MLLPSKLFLLSLAPNPMLGGVDLNALLGVHSNKHASVNISKQFCV